MSRRYHEGRVAGRVGPGRRAITVAAAAAVMTIACGAGEPNDPSSASASSGAERVIPATNRGWQPSRPVGTTTATSSRLTGQGVDAPPPDELAFVADDASAPNTVPATVPTTVPTTSRRSNQPESLVPRTPGRPGPVTTIADGGRANTSIYRGVLGSIGPDQVRAHAVVPAPTGGPDVLPLTGLAGKVPNRPAAVVKIDNGNAAIPQHGLNAADIVIEEEVESGLTWFAAIFHSTPSVVGPIRSGRTTDIGFINSLGSPLLLYSGANAVTDTLLRAQANVQNRSVETSSGYWRSSDRSAPSNLYSDLAPHWATATEGSPPPQFVYRDDGAAPGGVADPTLTVAYPESTAGWTWDGSVWLRTQGGRPHLTATGDQISAANVVVIEAERVATGMVDGSGAMVPEFVFVGTGPATVFTAGRRIDGTWTRPTLRSVATLTTVDGAVIALTPGRTWIQLIGQGSGIVG